MLGWLTLVVGLLAVGLSVFCEWIPRVNVLPHLARHTAFHREGIVPEPIAKDLLTLFQEIGEFSSLISTPKSTGYASKEEHIGEAVPVNAKGGCDHSLMVLNSDGTQCILADRIDLGRHYVLTGGLDGKKENIPDSVDRLSSFAKYIFVDDLDKFKPAKELFENSDFQAAAKRVCPSNSSVLDPFQFNFIVQVPGQTVAMHLDAPYFWGATRFDVPQWLLVTMVFSGLFRDRFVDQIQAVAYVHDWTGIDSQSLSKLGGQFVYFPDNETVVSVSPQPRSGTFVDGSKVLHAAKIYRPEVKAPKLPKDQHCALRWAANDRWQVQCDETNPANGKLTRHVNAEYALRDLRISIVYRARCFASEEQRQLYRQLHGPHAPANPQALGVEQILNTFKDDLVATRKTRLTRTQLEALPRLELASLLMDTYVKYPLPTRDSAWLPFNYCAIPLMVPALKTAFDLIC